MPEDEYVSPYLSAYTALAFNWLRDGGHAVPEAVETKLHAYLDAFLKRDTAPDFYTRGMASTVRAVALAALAKRGNVSLADLQRYREHVEYMSLFGRRITCRLRSRYGAARRSRARSRRSFCRARCAARGKISFNEVLDDGYLRISATPLNGSCAILSAIERRRELANGASVAQGDVPFELVRAITQARGSRDHWENTQENMFCMASLLDYARRYESVAPDLQARVSIGGQSLGTAQFAGVRDEAVTLARPIGPDGSRHGRRAHDRA